MEDTQNIQRLCIIGPSDRDDIQNQNEPNRYSEIVSLIEVSLFNIFYDSYIDFSEFFPIRSSFF